MRVTLTLYTLTSVCIFSILFSIHFLRCWQGEFVWQSRASLASFGFNTIEQNHPTLYLLLVLCLLFLISFGIKGTTIILLNQYFKLNIKVKLWVRISRISRRELDVSYLEQCNCNIYRNFKRYLVIDHFLDWDSLYLTVWSTCPNHSFIFIWQSACLKLGTYLLQILLGTLIYYITLNQNYEGKLPTENANCESHA